MLNLLELLTNPDHVDYSIIHILANRFINSSAEALNSTSFYDRKISKLLNYTRNESDGKFNQTVYDLAVAVRHDIRNSELSYSQFFEDFFSLMIDYYKFHIFYCKKYSSMSTFSCFSRLFEIKPNDKVYGKYWSPEIYSLNESELLLNVQNNICKFLDKYNLDDNFGSLFYHCYSHAFYTHHHKDIYEFLTNSLIFKHSTITLYIRFPQAGFFEYIMLLGLANWIRHNSSKTIEMLNVFNEIKYE